MEIKLREIREQKGMTQENLSELSGVSRATICSLESGKVSITTTKTMLAIANALEAKVSDIFLL